MIRILTDSTCDLLPKYLEKFDVEVLPLSVTFGDETFRDGVDLTHEEFYARLANAEKLPTTAQIPPALFEDAFRKHVEAGDEVLAILISSGISGTYQSACIAKEAVGSDAVHVVDSRQATLSLGLLVHLACLLRNNGKPVEEIERILNEIKKYARMWVIIDTLKYLKMGGRVSPAASVVGEIMGIKPLVTMEEGAVAVAGKVRGKAAAIKWVLGRMHMQNKADTHSAYVFGHTNAPESLEEFLDHFTLFTKTVIETRVGAVIGTHGGPGCIGVAYFETLPKDLQQVLAEG